MTTPDVNIDLHVESGNDVEMHPSPSSRVKFINEIRGPTLASTSRNNDDDHIEMQSLQTSTSGLPDDRNKPSRSVRWFRGKSESTGFGAQAEQQQPPYDAQEIPSNEDLSDTWQSDNQESTLPRPYEPIPKLLGIPIDLIWILVLAIIILIGVFYNLISSTVRNKSD